jgi:hypothetical protein
MLQKEASSELHELQEIPMAASWRLYVCCYISRTVAGIRKDLLLLCERDS